MSSTQNAVPAGNASLTRRCDGLLSLVPYELILGRQGHGDHGHQQDASDYDYSGREVTEKMQRRTGLHGRRMCVPSFVTASTASSLKKLRYLTVADPYPKTRSTEMVAWTAPLSASSHTAPMLGGVGCINRLRWPWLDRWRNEESPHHHEWLQSSISIAFDSTVEDIFRLGATTTTAAARRVA